MGGSTPQPPAPIDPSATANTQQQYNINAQAGSLFNQQTPYGSLSYSQTGTGPGGVPIYTAKTTLNPQYQSLVDQLTGQAASGIGGANYGAQDPSSVIGNATMGNTNALMNQFQQYLNPFFTQQTAQQQNYLENQGLTPNTPAYEQAMNNLRQSQGQTVAGYEAQIEPQAYAQAYQNYLAPLTIAGQELGLTTPWLAGPTSTAAATPTAAIQPPNYGQLATAAQQEAYQNYQAQLAQQNAMMGGLFGLGGTALGGLGNAIGGGGGLSGLFGGSAAADPVMAAMAFSDRRGKKNIKQVGVLDNGLPVYLFQYKYGGPYQIGVMAQDVELVNPDAVVTIDGLKHVYYDRAVS